MFTVYALAQNAARYRRLAQQYPQNTLYKKMAFHHWELIKMFKGK